jgi:hypothetical protein
VDFLFGLARNGRLVAEIETEVAQTRTEAEASGRAARRCRDFTWPTLNSWSRARRVVGEAEWTGGEANPRFVVTSLRRTEAEARHLYEADGDPQRLRLRLRFAGCAITDTKRINILTNS